LITFKSPAAASFFLKHKRKLPEGIYAEALLPNKENRLKTSRLEEFREMKARGKQVTWHRACLVEFVKGEGRGAGRWKEVMSPHSTKADMGREMEGASVRKVWMPVGVKGGK
jgi:hypothetical protein